MSIDSHVQLELPFTETGARQQRAIVQERFFRSQYELYKSAEPKRLMTYDQFITVNSFSLGSHFSRLYDDGKYRTTG